MLLSRRAIDVVGVPSLAKASAADEQVVSWEAMTSSTSWKKSILDIFEGNTLSKSACHM